MTDFNNMSSLEIVTWLGEHDGWSRDCFDDEILPILKSKLEAEKKEADINPQDLNGGSLA